MGLEGDHTPSCHRLWRMTGQPLVNADWLRVADDTVTTTNQRGQFLIFSRLAKYLLTDIQPYG